MIIKDSKFDLLGNILDLGCSTGLFGLEIKQVCEHLEGIDLSKKMLDEAKKKNKISKMKIAKSYMKKYVPSSIFF